MEDLASEEESDTGNLDDETRETIQAQAAAAAADAIAEEQVIHADTPDRYIAATHFVTLYVIHIFVITEKELESSTWGKTPWWYYIDNKRYVMYNIRSKSIATIAVTMYSI